MKRMFRYLANSTCALGVIFLFAGSTGVAFYMMAVAVLAALISDMLVEVAPKGDDESE